MKTGTRQIMKTVETDVFLLGDQFSATGHTQRRIKQLQEIIEKIPHPLLYF
jgi:hypothetical protein